MNSGGETMTLDGPATKAVSSADIVSPTTEAASVNPIPPKLPSELLTTQQAVDPTEILTAMAGNTTKSANPDSDSRTSSKTVTAPSTKTLTELAGESEATKKIAGIIDQGYQQLGMSEIAQLLSQLPGLQSESQLLATFAAENTDPHKLQKLETLLTEKGPLQFQKYWRIAKNIVISGLGASVLAPIGVIPAALMGLTSYVGLHKTTAITGAKIDYALKNQQAIAEQQKTSKEMAASITATLNSYLAEIFQELYQDQLKTGETKMTDYQTWLAELTKTKPELAKQIRNNLKLILENVGSIVASNEYSRQQLQNIKMSLREPSQPMSPYSQLPITNPPSIPPVTNYPSATTLDSNRISG